MSDTLKRKLARKIKATPAKRIAQIILPKTDNDGNSLVWQHEQYQKAFCAIYGGYTSYEVQGGWMNDEGKLYRDESIAYHIAMDDMGTIKLRALAQAAAHELKQECIFIVLPNGNVEFISKDG